MATPLRSNSDKSKTVLPTDEVSSSLFIKYGPLCYLFFILLAILIIFIVVYFCSGQSRDRKSVV